MIETFATGCAVTLVLFWATCGDLVRRKGVSIHWPKVALSVLLGGLLTTVVVHGLDDVLRGVPL